MLDDFFIFNFLVYIIKGYYLYKTYSIFKRLIYI